MKSLFPKDFNWAAFILFAFLVRIFFVDLSLYSYFAILLSFHQFLLFFYSVGKIIPVRYMLGIFMCLQFFVGPTLAYNGFDQYQYIGHRMKISEDEYFSYVIPAVLSFIIGLHVNSNNLMGEHVDVEKIKVFYFRNPKLPYVFIILGLTSSILSSFFSSGLAFVFYLLGSFKFIGLFIIVLSGTYLKPVPLILVFGSIISTSLGDGMFHDLLTWIIFTACIYGIRFNFGTYIKVIGLSVFILFAIIIQQLKGTYRQAIGKEEAGVETFTEVYEKQSDNGLLSFESLAPSVTRINQGFIITNIMNNIPSRVPFSEGEELMQILEAAFLPRFLAPNKLTAGNREIFTKYSGIKLREGTSMGLSSVGDAYINYGVLGGCIFMFVLGFFYNYILKIFQKKGNKFPILILFTTLAFYYPIRPDCELQTILGHIVKACFVIFLLFTFFKDQFYHYRLNANEVSS